MFKWFMAFLGVFFSTFVLAREVVPRPPAAQQPVGQQEADQQEINRPQIDVVFVLDTTGSMSGLIAGAKAKIWSLANEMMEAEGIPNIRFGLVGYRDRGDAYITRRHDLSNDMDAVYSKLTQFQAEGGGDWPESVNQALYEAVTTMSWNRADNTLRLVFLVGDAPPHTNYQGDMQYADTIDIARKNDIIINTIQCGSANDTRQIWQAMAKQGHGNYVGLSQSGSVITIKTPYDEEIAKLSRDQDNTIMLYGSASLQTANRGKVAAMTSAPAATRADKAGYTSKNAKFGKMVTGRGDLLSDMAQEEVDFDDIAENELPTELKALPKPERKEYVEKKAKQRDNLQQQINALVKKRDAYIKTEKAKLAAKGQQDSFDSKVMEFVAEQAKRKGITYQ